MPELEDNEAKIVNPNEMINVPLSDEDKETVVTVEADEKGQMELPLEDQADGKEHEVYSTKVKKRIDKLTAKAREAERREQAAIQYAQSLQRQLSSTAQRAQSLNNGYLTEAEKRLNSQLSIVEANLQDAIERGDGKATVEAQKLLSQVMMQQERVKAAKKQPIRSPQAPPIPQELTKRAKQPDPKAEEWAEENEWFGSDSIMTNAAYAIHNDLATEGFDLSSDEYYDELNSRMRNAFPHKFRKPQADISNVQNVAPATRSVGITGRSRQIKLTPSEVSIARRLGVPLEEYAKHVRR